MGLNSINLCLELASVSWGGLNWMWMLRGKIGRNLWLWHPMTIWKSKRKKILCWDSIVKNPSSQITFNSPKLWEKVSLQTNLERNLSNYFGIITANPLGVWPIFTLLTYSLKLYTLPTLTYFRLVSVTHLC